MEVTEGAIAVVVDWACSPEEQPAASAIKATTALRRISFFGVSMILHFLVLICGYRCLFHLSRQAAGKIKYSRKNSFQIN